MGALSDYLENICINHLLRNQAFTPPTTVYLALFLTTSTGIETNNPTAEVSGGAYARQSCALDAAAAGATANTSDVTFPTATADWGTLRFVALVDHATATNWGTGVNVLVWGQLTTDKLVNNGDIFKVLAGDLDFAID